MFWCIPCTATPEISSLSKNIYNTAHVSRLLSVSYDYDYGDIIYDQTYNVFFLQKVGRIHCIISNVIPK